MPKDFLPLLSLIKALIKVNWLIAAEKVFLYTAYLVGLRQG